uniref:Uncharacterized protein n=1 Tax=Timema bartmani TaxID=61472 RepID=A0A7R9I2A4_9NEOP|nr:unnamed protein product [Timema bartmani]
MATNVSNAKEKVFTRTLLVATPSATSGRDHPFLHDVLTRRRVCPIVGITQTIRGARIMTPPSANELEQPSANGQVQVYLAACMMLHSVILFLVFTPLKQDVYGQRDGQPRKYGEFKTEG